MFSWYDEIQKIKSWIDNNIEGDMSLPQLAGYIGYSLRDHFCKYAIRPVERCDNWVMSGYGEIFLEAVIGIAFHNKELEPYDMSKLVKIPYKGMDLYVSGLEMLKQDNINYNRMDRVKAIEERMNQKY